jgi:hypothetical protein
MGGGGWWWQSQPTWAEAAGLSPRTLERAVADLKEQGLITAQPYLRPPGAGPAGGKRGTSNYRLDPSFLSAGSATDGGTRDVCDGEGLQAPPTVGRIVTGFRPAL